MKEKLGNKNEMSRVFLPQPREVKVLGCKSVNPSQLVINVADNYGMLQLAAKDIADFLTNLANQKIRIINDNGNKLSEELFVINIRCGDNGCMPLTGYQKNSIYPTNQGLELVGLEPIGAFYAVKTLKQAVAFSEGMFKIPILEVSDSAELAERGFWDYFYPAPIRETSEMHTLGTIEQWYKFLDDLVDYKINLLELEIGDEGLYYNSKKFPELVKSGTPLDKNKIIKNVISYARDRGIHVFLATWHPEHWADLKQFYPETAAVNPVGCQPRMLEHTYCFSHPKTREIYAGIIEEISELFTPEGISAWIPENLGRCTCQECTSQGYLSAYYSIIEQSIAKVRKRQPNIRMRFLASFMRYSDRFLKKLPKDSELLYYECDKNGMYGFPENKILSPYVKAIAKTGVKVVGCLNFRGSGQNYVPLPFLRNVEEWVRKIIEEGYYGVNGSIYSNPGVCRINILRMADMAWNPEGRNSKEFLYAYCIRNKLSNPTLRSELLYILSDVWELYHRKLGGIIEGHALDCILTRQAGNFVDSVYMTDTLEFRDLPDLREGLIKIADGIKIAQETGDESILRQFRACEIRFKSLYHILSALHVFGRELWPDPEKGAWEDWIQEIRAHLEKSRSLLEELPTVTLSITSSWPGVQGDPSVNDEGCLKKLNRVLDPEFLEELANRAWPDSNSFA